MGKEVEGILTRISHIFSFLFFSDRQKDRLTGKYLHKVSNQLDSCLRDDIQRMKKIRSVNVYIYISN